MMKFYYLLSVVLLLVPLAIADESAPLVKIIYDQDYVVAEGSNMIEYKIRADSFEFATSDIHADDSYLKLQDNNLLGQNLSFTVELIGRLSGNWPRNVCKENSSEKFRDWITWCFGKAIIREPTPEELAQVQQYRKEQGETKKPFQINYYEGAFKTQSAGLRSLYSNVWPADATVRFHAIAADHSGKMEAMMAFDDGSLETSKFIVEGLPNDTPPTDCMRSEHSFLKPTECGGPVKLRNFAN